ncbi:VTC domain-containing protein [Psychrosphaera saromensis]|uniref:polyphosphate polymerase domain-containing protein n=1 Tax=Psychrosphaera saromensis TaxID=716813 RepID=UPI000CF44904|nr:polyphosphate polymerase domain-containing protein [Psychrosphaera saromensis]GHB68299.1 VTC domain-containing protein [Psychrosphaera saromensis]GLQ15178.1 VTC domain-containing protein [Psychrosphaera saromensis]
MAAQLQPLENDQFPVNDLQLVNPKEDELFEGTDYVGNLLASFDSYQLTDLSNANLMNRVDSKFILPMSFLPELLGELKSMYRVLDIAGKRCFSYYNQYLDTPAMDLYQAHHNGKLNRYKVRRRCYVDTATEYLEVKLKNNQKRTVKTRIKLSTDKNNDADCLEFLAQEMHGKYADLHVIQQGGYKRMAFANEEKAERLTLDFDLWYNSKDSDNQVKLPGFFIAELKQSKISKSSPFYQLMSKHHIFPTSFSKYCIGCALLYPNQIKVNQFKSVLSRIKQLHRCEPLLPAESN